MGLPEVSFLIAECLAFLPVEHHIFTLTSTVLNKPPGGAGLTDLQQRSARNYPQHPAGNHKYATYFPKPVLELYEMGVQMPLLCPTYSLATSPMAVLASAKPKRTILEV